MREPAEMAGCLLGGLGDDRHVQASADYSSDVSEWHALIGDSVIPGSGGTLLEHQPVEMGRVEAVHRGPAVEPVANIRRNSLLTRDANEGRNKAVVAVAVH